MNSGVGRAPLNEKGILIVSFNYASAIREEIKAIAWDLVVIDEAHKLRNAYRPSNKVGQGIRWATEDCRKLLLTATPLQNSLLELYGLSTLIDEHLFGDMNAFRSQYASAGSSLDRSATAACDLLQADAAQPGRRIHSIHRAARHHPALHVRPTTSMRCTRRSRPSCSATTATPSRNANGT